LSGKVDAGCKKIIKQQLSPNFDWGNCQHQFRLYFWHYPTTPTQAHTQNNDKTSTGNLGYMYIQNVGISEENTGEFFEMKTPESHTKHTYAS
jgi:hypothetical protein